MNEPNVPRELFIINDEMTNILEDFGKKLKQREDSSKKITNWKPAWQLSISLCNTLSM